MNSGNKKEKNLYVCTNCDAQFLKWSGRCLECGKWGSLQPRTVREGREEAPVEAAEATDLKQVPGAQEERMETGIGEADRVLGGGLVPGSLSLLSGEPGSGKSTLVAQIADKLASGSLRREVVYVSGEESASQVKGRLERLNCDLESIKFMGETDVEKIVAGIKKIKPAMAIIDSIQTVHTSEVSSEAGGVNQIRAATAKFLETAKKENIAVVIIGHITKDGQVAGPKSLEHIVDTVMYLEGGSAGDHSILRAAKNRFGSVNEIGVFEMTSFGFQEISNPSSVFLEQEQNNIPGSVISCVLEGTRPFLVDIQALVSKTVFGYPQRKASGVDVNRIQILTAVLTKRTKINLTNQDVVVNVVGGLKINDPSLDLALCTAMAASLLNQTLSRDTIILGEVGLGGEVRNIPKLESRLKEAEKLGFTTAVIPNTEVKAEKIKLNKITQVGEVLDLF